jgi:hypothetical protein
MLWNGCHILDCSDAWRRLGSAGRIKAISNTTAKVATQLGIERCY